MKTLWPLLQKKILGYRSPSPSENREALCIQSAATSGCKKGSFLHSLNNQRGIALIMAISALTILTYLAMEVSYDTTVEYTVNSQGINRIKAYYAAKSAMQLGLLRVKMYQQIMASPFGAQLGSKADQIWQFPLAWPVPIPKELNSVDRDTIKKAAGESLMQASWDLSISDEGSKIDLNDLVSPSKTLRDITRQQILTIFETAKEQDEAWRKKNSDLKPEEIVNALTDWQSSKNESVGGGDKRALFAGAEGLTSPNRAFRTLEEIRLIPQITDEIYELIAPRLTIYGMKAINPNTASEKVLASLDPSITDKIVTDLVKYRNENNGFSGKDDQQCAENFWNIAAGKFGARPSDNAKKVPLTCKTLSTFRIVSAGVVGDGKNAVRRDIQVVVMNLGQVANRIKNYIAEEKKKENPQDTSGQQSSGGQQQPSTNPQTSGSTGKANEPLPKGPPRIVYWNEK